MRPTGSQNYEAGDIIALSFDSVDQEAVYIAETVRALREVAFREGERERGLSWSDMAVLLRSVKRNGEPITQAFEAAGIPFVVAGMTNLFGAPEAEAARQLFYFMAGRAGVDEAAVERAWNEARLGISLTDLKKAIEGISRARASLTDPDQKRWGFYSIQRTFLTFLEEAGIREERAPDGRGEVVFYNLGKFSQLISDFETIHYHSKPDEKYDSFANFLEYRAEDAYPEGWQDNQYANPDAVRIMTVHQAKGMQWPVVFVPALLKNRDNRAIFDKIEFSEKHIEISLGDGVTVTGRIDLVRRIDTGETTIVDLKSSDRAQAEDVTEAQLHVYALGYQDLTGRRPDYVEIYELDERKRKPRSVDDDFIADVKIQVRQAAEALRRSALPASPMPKKCSGCDYRGMCTAGARVAPVKPGQ